MSLIQHGRIFYLSLLLWNDIPIIPVVKAFYTTSITYCYMCNTIWFDTLIHMHMRVPFVITYWSRNITLCNTMLLKLWINSLFLSSFYETTNTQDVAINPGWKALARQVKGLLCLGGLIRKSWDSRPNGMVRVGLSTLLFQNDRPAHIGLIYIHGNRYGFRALQSRWLIKKIGLSGPLSSI